MFILNNGFSPNMEKTTKSGPHRRKVPKMLKVDLLINLAEKWFPNNYLDCILIFHCLSFDEFFALLQFCNL